MCTNARAVVDVADVDRAVAQPNELYRMFDFRGGLTVIAIPPFVEGSHIPNSKAQLLEVARHMKRIHEAGLLHGDPRLLNMVFSENGTSRLWGFPR